jgi:plastocyanin
MKTLVAVMLASAATRAAEARAADHAISQKGKVFSAEALKVKAGDNVDFNNDDDVAHNVLVKGPDGHGQNSGSQKPGTTFQMKAADKGDYEVRCGIHPKMKMTVHAE